ncbi:hypothetical protein TNCV_2721071 [Trichonephila clavipes]|nr:hypothetical protein TNCV_2721071 [Trichonephila clavipes]
MHTKFRECSSISSGCIYFFATECIICLPDLGNTANYLLNKLQVLQNQAHRTILNAPIYIPRIILHRELKITSIRSRIKTLSLPFYNHLPSHHNESIRLQTSYPVTGTQTPAVHQPFPPKFRLETGISENSKKKSVSPNLPHRFPSREGENDFFLSLEELSLPDLTSTLREITSSHRSSTGSVLVSPPLISY